MGEGRYGRATSSTRAPKAPSNSTSEQQTETCQNTNDPECVPFATWTLLSLSCSLSLCTSVYAPCWAAGATETTTEDDDDLRPEATERPAGPAMGGGGGAG